MCYMRRADSASFICIWWMYTLCTHWTHSGICIIQYVLVNRRPFSRKCCFHCKLYYVTAEWMLVLNIAYYRKFFLFPSSFFFGSHQRRSFSCSYIFRWDVIQFWTDDTREDIILIYNIKWVDSTDIALCCKCQQHFMST